MEVFEKCLHDSLEEAFRVKTTNNANKGPIVTDENAIAKVKELNLRLFTLLNISSQESILIKKFEDFFYKEENLKKLISILQMDDVSLRLIDYFIIKYCKKRKVGYKIIDNNTEMYFQIYPSYKSQLKSFNKKFFDPCSRGIRIPFFLTPETCIITTIGQLNFFKWAVHFGVIEYLHKHFDEIKEDHNTFNAHKKIVPPKQKVRKVLKTQTHKNILLSPISSQSFTCDKSLEVYFD